MIFYAAAKYSANSVRTEIFRPELAIAKLANGRRRTMWPCGLLQKKRIGKPVEARSQVLWGLDTMP